MTSTLKPPDSEMPQMLYVGWDGDRMEYFADSTPPPIDPDYPHAEYVRSPSPEKCPVCGTTPCKIPKSPEAKVEGMPTREELEKRPYQIAVDFAEKFQQNYPGESLAVMMEELRLDIEKFGGENLRYAEALQSTPGVEREWEKYCREVLWLGHGCPPAAQYGDDGEMQCGACGMDFKRLTLDEIRERFRKTNEQRLAEAMKAFPFLARPAEGKEKEK